MPGQFEVVEQAAPTPGQMLGKIALFDGDGNPVDLGGGGGSVGVDDVTGLQAALDEKADASELAGLVARIEALEGDGA